MDLCEVLAMLWRTESFLHFCTLAQVSFLSVFMDQHLPSWSVCTSSLWFRSYTETLHLRPRIKRVLLSTLGTPVLLSWEDLLSPEGRYFLVCDWYISRDRAVLPPCSTRSNMILLREVFLDHNTTGKYKHYQTVNTLLKSIAWCHLITILIRSIYWIIIVWLTGPYQASCCNEVAELNCKTIMLCLTEFQLEITVIFLFYIHFYICLFLVRKRECLFKLFLSV